MNILFLLPNRHHRVNIADHVARRQGVDVFSGGKVEISGAGDAQVSPVLFLFFKIRVY
jgi:hypothetical protein